MATQTPKSSWIMRMAQAMDFNNGTDLIQNRSGSAVAFLNNIEFVNSVFAEGITRQFINTDGSPGSDAPTKEDFDGTNLPFLDQDKFNAAMSNLGQVLALVTQKFKDLYNFRGR